jgi:glycosyltransferase involved in cell wall biosynthesis
MSEPFFSIITATFNAERCLPHLLNSLRDQSFGDFEWVVVDGVSKDATVNIVRRKTNLKISLLSERDNGIYDAFNKGVQLSKGKFIIFMGADDIFSDCNVLSDIYRDCLINLELPVVGGMRYEKKTKISYGDVGFKTLIINTVHHQAVFYPRNIMKRFSYDIKERVVSDYELNLLLYLKKIKINKTKRLISICGDAGVSRTTDEILNYKSYHRMRQRYCGKLLSYLFYLVGIANVYQRKLRNR